MGDFQEWASIGADVCCFIFLAACGACTAFTFFIPNSQIRRELEIIPFERSACSAYFLSVELGSLVFAEQRSTAKAGHCLPLFLSRNDHPHALVLEVFRPLC